MNKIIIATLAVVISIQGAYALDNVFDSMDKATEVKLAPAIKTTTQNTSENIKNVNSVYRSTIKEQKFNSALVNLDDAQVELRQELATTTSKYNEAVNEKNISMIKSKELLPLTGYIHGGCSPIGMKKQFKSVFHKTASHFDTIIFSGGKIGYQIEMKLEDLNKLFKFDITDIIV